MLAATEKVIDTEHDVLLGTTSWRADGAGPEFDAFNLAEILPGKGDDPGTQAAHKVDIIGGNGSIRHGIHEGRRKGRLGDDQGLERRLAGWNDKFNHRIGYLEEAITVGVPLTGSDEQQAGKNEVEVADDDKGLCCAR